jgi:hypothetical protein
MIVVFFSSFERRLWCHLIIDQLQTGQVKARTGERERKTARVVFPFLDATKHISITVEWKSSVFLLIKELYLRFQQ